MLTVSHLGDGTCDACGWYQTDIPLEMELLRTEPGNVRVYKTIQPYVCPGCGRKLETFKAYPPEGIPVEIFNTQKIETGVEYEKIRA